MGDPQLKIFSAPAGRIRLKKPKAQDRTRQTAEDRQAIAAAMRFLVYSQDTVYGNLVPDSPKSDRVRKEAWRLGLCQVLKTVHYCETDLQYYGIRCGCKSRACERCSRIYVKPYYKALTKRIAEVWSRRKKGWYVGFCTLTIQRKRFNEFPTQSQLAEAGRQVADFVRLFYGNRTADWDRFKKTGKIYPTSEIQGAGAIVVMEFSPAGFLHYHLITYGPFIPESTLRYAWNKITGDSFLVEIEAAKSPGQTANYPLKYIRKMPDFPDYMDYAVLAVIQKGMRRLKTYGVFYNSVKVEKPAPMRLYCLYCGGDLRCAGVHDDPRDQLIDWLQFKKYTLPAEGVYMRLPYNYANLPSTNWIHKQCFNEN